MNDEGTEFEVIGRSEAASSEAAIRSIVLANPVDGSYVAAPERSFVPVPITVEVPAPRLIFGDTPSLKAVPDPPKQKVSPSPGTPLQAVIAAGRSELDDTTA